MFRNYLNFIKSKLNFRCFKQIGGFGGTSRKKVPLGIKKQIPQTSSNRKSYSSFFSLLKEEKLMRNWKFYLQLALNSDSGIKRSFIVRQGENIYCRYGRTLRCTLLTQYKSYLAPLLPGSVHCDMVAHMAAANGSGIGKPPTPPPPRRCSPFLQSTQSMLMRPRPAAFRCTVEQLDSFLTLGLLMN